MTPRVSHSVFSVAEQLEALLLVADARRETRLWLSLQLRAAGSCVRGKEEPVNCTWTFSQIILETVSYIVRLTTKGGENVSLTCNEMEVYKYLVSSTDDHM